MKTKLHTSAISIYEIYRLSLQNEGRVVAEMRKTAIERDFEVALVDLQTAAHAGEIKVAHGSDCPLADAIIGAIALLRKLDCFTDDPHIKQPGGLRTRWVRGIAKG
jgi:predicted nucleic acid-binding protein